MADKSKYGSSVAFTDLLFNIVVGLAFLFLLAFILMNPIAKEKDIEEKSDFIARVVMQFPRFPNLGMVRHLPQCTIEAVQRVGSDIFRKVDFFSHTDELIFKLLQMK